jgi:hypothetical protein
MLRCRGVFPLARLGLLGLLAGAVFLLVLERDTPLFLNLGPGDEPFARGFRSGWERDGLQGSGETTFRWTEDGARLELPVVLAGADGVRVRFRAARFVDTPVQMSLFVGDRLVDRWTQEPRGWTVRAFDLGAISGPLRLRFRSSAADPADPLGLAVDWVEVAGAGRIVPRAELIPGLLLLFAGLPLLVALAIGKRASVAALILLLAGGAGTVLLDRLGGLVTLSKAGLPALLACAALAVAARFLIGRSTCAPPLAVSMATATLVLAALSHPGYHYPDVDTHTRYLQAIRSAPSLAWDAAPYQARAGAWIREIAGRKVAFPYSPAFHLLAWPLAAVVGDVAAVKTLAAAALGLSLLLTFALARGAGLFPPEALLAPVLLALLPVTSSRLVLALYPTLLGQACELLLVVALARGPETSPPLGWRTLACLLLLAQAAYTGSLFNVAAFVGMLAILQAAAGRRAEGLRLLLAWVLTALVVVVVLYGRFLTTFWREVMPHLGETPASASVTDAPGLAAAARRLAFFYDIVFPILVGLGLLALRRARGPGRRVLLAGLLGGASLLLLRFLLPTLFRDAKEIEMLAPVVAVVSAAGLGWLSERGRAGQATALACCGWALAWGLARAASAYAERFVAVGR